MTTPIQKRILLYVDKVLSLPSNIRCVFEDRQSSNKSPQITFYELIDNSSFLMHTEDIFLFAEEVISNLKTITRDGLEYTYLNDLDYTFSRVIFLNKIIKVSNNLENVISEPFAMLTWRDAIVHVVEELYTEEGGYTKDAYITLLLDVVEHFCGNLENVCRYAASKAKSSIIFSNKPDLFPSINSLIYKSSYQTDKSEKERNNTHLEPVIKLNWNGTNRSLYDLFAQLSLTNTISGEPLLDNTINDIARFISINFSGMPSVDIVEREFQKMREANGIEKAKRGKIDLNISK